MKPVLSVFFSGCFITASLGVWVLYLLNNITGLVTIGLSIIFFTLGAILFTQSPEEEEPESLTIGIT